MPGDDGASAPKFKLPSFKHVQKQNAQRAQLRSNFTSGNPSPAAAGPSHGSSSAAAGPSGQPAQATARQPPMPATAFVGSASGAANWASARPFTAHDTGAARPTPPGAGHPQMPGNYTATPATPSYQPSAPAQPMYPARPPAGFAGAYTSHVTHGNAILVNSNQRGNPILKYLRNVNHRFADIVPDFQFNDKTAAVFLSLKFHRLRPQYMHERIKALNRAFRTFLLCHCDVEDPINPLAEVSQGAVDANVTLIVAFSDMEAARYLELLKAYENKAADALKPQAETDYVARVAKVLTRVRAVNKTDSAVMGSKLRTLADVFQASEADLGAVPGLGPAKVKRLFAAFDTPFYVGRTQAAAGGGAAVDGSGAATTAGCNEAEAREWAATQEAGMDEVDISDDEGELL